MDLDTGKFKTNESHGHSFCVCLLPGCQVLGKARPTVSRLLLPIEFWESLVKSFFYFLLQLLLIIVIYYRHSAPCTLFSFPAQCLVFNLVELRETNRWEFPHLSPLDCQTTCTCKHFSLSSGPGRVAFSCPRPVLSFLPLSDSNFLSLSCPVFITYLSLLSSFSMSPVFLPFARRLVKSFPLNLQPISELFSSCHYFSETALTKVPGNFFSQIQEAYFTLT